MTAGTLLVGLPLGIALAVGLRQRRKAAYLPALAVVEVGRGFPVLVLMYLMYFGLPQVSITLNALVASVLALGISFAAYTAEVFRAGLDAIPPGQREAGMALGLAPWVLFRRVMLPQAVKIVIPPLLGWSIIFFQATSLAYTLAVPELMSRAYTLATSNFLYLDMLVLAAVLYAAVSIPLSLVAEHLSVRGSRSAAAKPLDSTTLLK